MSEISKKVQESSLKWYGHVLRREEECIAKRVTGKGEEHRSQCGWTTSGMTCRRENCKGRKRKTELNYSHKKHRPHIKAGKDSEGEVEC